MIFNDELIACLPNPVQAKLLRMESSPDDATRALLGRAAYYLDLHGAWTRYVKHGIRCAHVVPAEPPPIGGYTAAVADVRGRIIALDAAWTQVEESTLAQPWKDVHATDIGLARLALERIEESIICAAEDHGVTIDRRADMDIAALLEIERA